MPNEPFMLVSLKGDKAKKLAQVMANPTCTRILDHLAQAKETTETQIAKDLKIPLSTVHYNLQQLVAAKLVVVDEFHYSAKGREVNHYKLANKYIIIAPKEDDPHFLDRLKKFLPVTVLTLATAAVLKTMQFFTPGAGLYTAESDAAALIPPSMLPLSAPMADVAERASADMMVQAAEGSAGAVAGASAQEASSVAAMKTADAGAAESMRAFAATGVDGARDAVVNSSMNSSLAVSGTPAAPVEQFVPSVDPTSFAGPNATAHLPWWQSPVIDWFLIGAAFVLVILLVGELIAHVRAKRKQ